MKKLTVFCMAAVMVISMLAGCGGSDSGTNSTSNESGASSESKSSSEGEKILRFGCFDYVDSVDPGNIINAAWNCTRFGVGECLFHFNDAMEAEPYLCDTYEVSDDHKTWTFHIRDGVKFSNGEDLPQKAVPPRKNIWIMRQWRLTMRQAQ